MIVANHLGVLLLDHPGAAVSQGLLEACADNNVVVVSCDVKHQPNLVLLPLSGHSVQAEALRAQIGISVPRRKRLWQQLVRGKIAAQARTLEACTGDSAPLTALIPLVRSGDPQNVEARAARAYWQRLFGPSFRRERNADGVNSLLNYGYAVLRASVARSVCAAGLHPSVELHHHNRYDSLCLASDLMEPLRPAVDRQVHEMTSEGGPAALGKESKATLLGLLDQPVQTAGRAFPLHVAMQHQAVSLRGVALGQRQALDIPVV